MTGGTMIFLTSLWLTLISLVRADISYPATVEVDVLFPLNKTYNDLPSFPVVFAIQNAEAAYSWRFTIGWHLDPVGGETTTFEPTGPTIYSWPSQNDFQYYFDDVAIAASAVDDFLELEARQYRLEWSYVSRSCSNTPTGLLVDSIPVAEGEVWFTVVKDGSGSAFDIPLNECPASSSLFSARDATDAAFCPFLTETVGEPQPCAGRLKSETQVSCLKDFFAGNNETEACLSSFEKVDPTWGVQTEDDDLGDDDESNDDEIEESIEELGLAPPDDDSEGGESGSGSDDVPGLAVQYNLWMPLLVAVGSMVTWMNL